MEFILALSTYLIIPLIGISLWKRYSSVNFPGVYVIIFGLTPILIAKLVSIIILFFPGIEFWKIQWTILILCFLGAVSLRHTPSLELKKIITPASLLALFIGVLAISAPFYANDPLKYASLSRIFFRDMSFASYPLASADPQTGFFVVTSHPIGYPALLLWSYIMQGSADYLGWGRLIAPFYCLLTTILLTRTLSQFGLLASTLGGLALLLVPGYIYGIFIHHLDALRVFLFFAAVLTFVEYSKKQSRSLFLLTSLLTGMTVWSHSSGILILLFLPLIGLFIVQSEPRVKLLKATVLIILLALVLGGEQFAYNLLKHASPIHNEFNIPVEMRADYSTYSSHMFGLTDSVSRLVKGALVEFSAITEFGYLFWVTLALTLFCLARRQSREILIEPLNTASLLTIITFIILAIVTGLSGIDHFINSYRYSLILVPFAAYLVARVCPKSLSLPAVILLAVGGNGTIKQISNHLETSKSWQLHYFTNDLSRVTELKYTEGDLIDYIRSETPTDAKFLIFRPMEFWYYANRFGLRSTDPSLMSLFEAPDEVTAKIELNKLGINYIYSDGERDPLYLQSKLSLLLNDPQYVSILSEDSSKRVLQLKSKKDDYSTLEIPVSQNSSISTGWASVLVTPSSTGKALEYLTISCSVASSSFVETFSVEEDVNGIVLESSRISNTFVNGKELRLDFLLRPTESTSKLRLDFRDRMINSIPNVSNCTARGYLGR